MDPLVCSWYALATSIRRETDRALTPAEMTNPTEEYVQLATEDALHLLAVKHARKLGVAPLKGPRGEELQLARLVPDAFGEDEPPPFMLAERSLEILHGDLAFARHMCADHDRAYARARKRPRSHTAEQRVELATRPHSITSSARGRKDSGILRPSDHQLEFRWLLYGNVFRSSSF